MILCICWCVRRSPGTAHNELSSSCSSLISFSSSSLLALKRRGREEAEGGGVNALSRRCRKQRRGHRRLHCSPVRQDCVQQLRLGILQDSRPRPPVATVFCSRRTTCDTSTTLRRVVECSGNCSRDADLLRVTFNMACHVDRLGSTVGHANKKQHLS